MSIPGEQLGVSGMHHLDEVKSAVFLAVSPARPTI
jgi:hypothetical protein